MHNVPLSYNAIDQQAIIAAMKVCEGMSHEQVVKIFEQKIAEFTGAKYVVALNSGTAAIHLALRAVGISAGEVVFTSTSSYVASVNPICYLGAQPYFIDSEMQTWNMDPVLLRSGIEDAFSRGMKPGAVLLVHSYGNPAKLNEILAMCHEFNIPLIEDAAEAIGSFYHSRHVGTFSEVGILSFNSNKILTTYGGGAILTENGSYAEKIRYWSTQARDQASYYNHREIGYNYKMSVLNAIAGISQWTQLPDHIQKRQTTFDHYNRLFAQLPGAIMQNVEKNCISNRWLSCVLIDAGKRKYDALKLIEQLRTTGIELRPVWNPMHSQPVFKGCRQILNGNATKLFENGLCLPSGIAATPEIQNYIFSCLLDYLEI